ncbi:uroporphyrinogen-III synthase [Deinococcus deserti]|uniref:Putative uroporphyrinogen III synthase HEM4 n=1 Tax=Deinococcus deserti (strain DSM 17065 / CIP 109153 / LMG 22923 / VCD115) TaxID=546414 RepID=C1CX88_DEIDV|nr:uroporphyrinogen-III synthase [Deinococcus deserti]ACO46805.1 putative uroporphyrinogen III synthase HEM4 [Deinococcus deserti VCD115]
MDWFGGLRVLSLESRRSEEMTTLIQKYGGIPTVAPSMREQKLDLTAALSRFEADLRAGEVHAVVCMTGVGTRMFLQDLLARDAETLARLQGVPFVVRGSKPAQALKTFGLSGISVPRPHTWHEVQDHLLQTLQAGQHAVMLEYGDAPPAAMLRTLAQAGIRVTSVPVYRCAFPADTLPLAHAIRDTVLFGQDVLLLSSGTQVLHLLKFAERLKLQDELRVALNRMVVVSIGPACSESAGELGIRIDLECNPHKMGILVRMAAEHAPGLLRQRLDRVS